MYNTGLLRFKHHKDEYGSLTPIEGSSDIPFEIKRVYYIYDVLPEVTRGFHSHRKLHQVLISLGGSVTVRLKTPHEEKSVTLKNPYEGLYIGPHIWREMCDFSPGSILLVLASDFFDETDYIRSFYDYENTYPFRDKDD